jgi:hypothetical protein
MYIKAVVKDRTGKTFEVVAKNGCTIILPRGLFEQARFAYATNLLLGQFYQKIKPYANQNHAIVEITTDNALLTEKFAKEGYKTSFMPLESEQIEA